MMTALYRLMNKTRPEKGSVFVLVAISAMMLIAATGVAVDMARAQILQGRIQTALDAAGLAAGATALTGPATLPSYCGSSTWVQCQAQKYFNANFPTGYLSSGTVTVVATISADNSTVALSANTTQSTTFLQVIGITQVAVAANTQITRANEGMELVLVLDNTGSMTTVLPGDSLEKIQALKNSINDSGGLLDILYGTGNNTAPNLWVGVVPFGDMVNIGTGHSAWMDATADASLDFGPTITGSGSGATCARFGSTSGTAASSGSTRCSYTIPTSSPQPNFGMTNWAGCVDARSGTTVSPTDSTMTLDDSDDPPSSTVSGTYFPAFLYPSTSGTASSSNTCSGGSNAWNCSRTKSGNQITTYYQEGNTTGGNTGCTIASVMGMVAEKDTVENEVNTMTASGSTMLNLGLVWGYRMLSPNWQGIWGGEMDSTGNTQFPVLPLAYHTPLMNKVVIFMTDGTDNTASDQAYIGQTTPTDAQLDSKTEAICDKMKANGVIIYTIGFGTTDNPADSSSSTYVDGTLLKYCATQTYTGDTSHYFLATGSVSLTSAFQQIGSVLANLRISE